MARSRRMAGACRRPIEGKRCPGQARPSSPGSPVCESRTARCARPGSPHRPSSDRSCACRRSAAFCHPSRSTTVTGQVMSVEEGRDVLEQDDERRRQQDPRREHEGEVQRDRQERGLHRIIAAVGLAEHQAIQAREQRAERHQQCKSQDDGERWFACERGRDDEKQRSPRSEEHTSELQSLTNLVCRLLLEKKNIIKKYPNAVTNHEPDPPSCVATTS